MFRFVPIVFLLALFSLSADAVTCRQMLSPGDHVAALSCLLSELDKRADLVNPGDLVQEAYYVYITRANDPASDRFFRGMRSAQPDFLSVLRFKERLLQKYSFAANETPASSATWAMLPQDARALFMFSIAFPQQIPPGMKAALKLSIYDDFERYFLLAQAQNQTFGVLPSQEYARLKTVLEQMDDSPDAYLKAVNSYYQGLVCMNLGGWDSGRKLVEDSRVLLRALIAGVEDRLSRKRILRNLAAADDVLGYDEEAKGAYYSLLQIDPQDWTTIMNLSYLLNERGECNETSIWVEATLPPRQELFDITIHCGSQELPDEEFHTEPPAIATLLEEFRNLPAWTENAEFEMLNAE